ncbi:MAG: GNAT family N-acetyltransferase [Gaiellaceae bacterium]
MGEFELRPPAAEEAEAVTQLIAACDIAEYGSADIELDDVLVDWGRPGFDLARDAVVAVEDGRIVGYAAITRSGHRDAYVAPEQQGRGIGSRLLAWSEKRAAEQLAPGESVLLGEPVASVNEAARKLLESAGYEPVRSYWRMVAPLERPPPSPTWPQGVRVRTFDRERDDRAVHTLIQQSFGDNERHVPESFEEWEAGMIDREAFEPGLWFVAESEGRVVGAVLCPAYDEDGWIRQLAVSRDWRRRGLGTALLYQAMAEFHRRGRKELGLVVDSWNRTGAREMYERAGMRVDREHFRYEKEISAAS